MYAIAFARALAAVPAQRHGATQSSRWCAQPTPPAALDKDGFDPRLSLPAPRSRPGAFVIPTEDFEGFAQAVRRKLILEIAGKAPAEAIALG